MVSCVRLSLLRQCCHQLSLVTFSYEVELVKHSAFPNHQLRTKEPNICDPSVQQYSGYLDVTDGKHLFYWFVTVSLHRSAKQKSMCLTLGFSSRGAIQVRTPSFCGSTVALDVVPLLVCCLNLDHASSPTREGIRH